MQRLASVLGSGLTGVVYVLDEPTLGLHPRDTRGLIRVLKRLREEGNTLLVIEHDEEVIEAADQAGLAMVFTGMRHFRH